MKAIPATTTTDSQVTFVDRKTGRVILLHQPQQLFGRLEADIVFPSDGLVSRKHWRTNNQDGSYFIEDLGSSNRTYLNDRALAPLNAHRLKHGDVVRFGHQILVFNNPHELQLSMAGDFRPSPLARKSQYLRQQFLLKPLAQLPLTQGFLLTVWVACFLAMSFLSASHPAIPSLQDGAGALARFFLLYAALPALFMAGCFYFSKRTVWLYALLATLAVTQFVNHRWPAPATAATQSDFSSMPQ